MYQESDYNQVHSLRTRYITIYAIIAALVLAGFVACLILRIAWPLYVIAAVFTVASVFFWGVFGSRVNSYWRFLKDIRTGRESIAEGILSSIEEHDTTRDGVEFRTVRLMVGDDTDKQGGRLLYVDSSRLPLPMQPGQRVAVKLFGNFIKDIQTLKISV